MTTATEKAIQMERLLRQARWISYFPSVRNLYIRIGSNGDSKQHLIENISPEDETKLVAYMRRLDESPYWEREGDLDGPLDNIKMVMEPEIPFGD